MLCLCRPNNQGRRPEQIHNSPATRAKKHTQAPAIPPQQDRECASFLSSCARPASQDFTPSLSLQLPIKRKRKLNAGSPSAFLFFATHRLLADEARRQRPAVQFRAVLPPRSRVAHPIHHTASHAPLTNSPEEGQTEKSNIHNSISIWVSKRRHAGPDSSKYVSLTAHRQNLPIPIPGLHNAQPRFTFPFLPSVMRRQ